MRVYIAAPFFNPEQLAIVESIESKLDEIGIPYFSPRSGGVLKDMDSEKQMQTKKQIFDSNISEMDDCTHMIACVAHKDTGTSFEIGYYCAMEKPIVLFSEKIECVNVMLAEAAISICDNLDFITLSLDGSYSAKLEKVI